MKIGIMQPYFLPYIGYFQLINCVDKFVIYDDVQFINRGWINRNKTLVSNKKNTILLSIKKDKYDLNINQRYFTEDFDSQYVKIINGIERRYIKAPYYNDVIILLKKIFEYNHESVISDFIGNSIKEVCDYLDIKTDILVSSKLKKDNNLKSEEKIMDIVKVLEGNEYINPIGGVDLYSKELFSENGIKLNFIKTNNISYRQFDKEFVPNLSIIDVLMFNSKQDVRKLLLEYTLV